MTLVDGTKGRLQRRRPVAADVVTERESLADELARRRAGVGQPERREHQVAHRTIDRRAGDSLDDATGDAEPGVVVAPRRARRR